MHYIMKYSSMFVTQAHSLKTPGSMPAILASKYGLHNLYTPKAHDQSLMMRECLYHKRQYAIIHCLHEFKTVTTTTYDLNLSTTLLSQIEQPVP